MSMPELGTRGGRVSEAMCFGHKCDAMSRA